MTENAFFVRQFAEERNSWGSLLLSEKVTFGFVCQLCLRKAELTICFRLMLMNAQFSSERYSLEWLGWCFQSKFAKVEGDYFISHDTNAHQNVFAILYLLPMISVKYIWMVSIRSNKNIQLFSFNLLKEANTFTPQN